MKKNYVIKTKDFTLRPLRMSDKASIAKHANNKILARNTLNLPHPYSVKDATEWIKKESSNYRKKKPSDFVFGIEIDGNIVGAVGIHKIEHGHKAEIGYWLGEEYWGKGIMTNAVKKASAFTLKQFKLKRILGCVFLFNIGSARVLEKNGFVYEGLMRKAVKKGNKFIDKKIYALVR